MMDDEQLRWDISFIASVVAKIYSGHYSGAPDLVKRMEEISYRHRPKTEDDAREHLFSQAYKNMAEEW